MTPPVLRPAQEWDLDCSQAAICSSGDKECEISSSLTCNQRNKHSWARKSALPPTCTHQWTRKEAHERSQWNRAGWARSRRSQLHMGLRAPSGYLCLKGATVTRRATQRQTGYREMGRQSRKLIHYRLAIAPTSGGKTGPYPAFTLLQVWRGSDLGTATQHTH